MQPSVRVQDLIQNSGTTVLGLIILGITKKYNRLRIICAVTLSSGLSAWDALLRDLSYCAP
jgi:hypothetical protein